MERSFPWENYYLQVIVEVREEMMDSLWWKSHSLVIESIGVDKLDLLVDVVIRDWLVVRDMYTNDSIDHREISMRENEMRAFTSVCF